jgi:PEP-CTERM motif
MNKVNLVGRWRCWFGLFLLTQVVGVAQQASAQLAGQFQSAPGTTAAYQYQRGSIQTVNLPADIAVTFSGTGSNATLTATIHQPIIGDTLDGFDYPIVNEFPMDVTGTSSDGQSFHGNLLGTQYLFDWSFEAAAPGELSWSGRVYWAGGRYELTTIADARLVAVLPGDYNADGTVDAGDYLVWRKGGGTSTSYEAWRARFGEAASGAASGSGSSAAVPEPATLVLVMIAVAGWRGKRRDRLASGYST